MKYLTFLDYPTLEATGRSYEAKLREKDKDIEALRQRDRDNTERIANLETRFNDLIAVINQGLFASSMSNVTSENENLSNLSEQTRDKLIEEIKRQAQRHEMMMAELKKKLKRLDEKLGL